MSQVVSPAPIPSVHTRHSRNGPHAALPANGSPQSHVLVADIPTLNSEAREGLKVGWLPRGLRLYL